MSRPIGQDTPDSAVGKAFTLLGAFSHDRPVFSVRELAGRTGIPRSTVHRLASELVAWGALDRTPHGLTLGVRLFEIGALAPTSGSLRDRALPYSHHLHEVTGLTVNLAIRRGNDIVYIDKIRSRALRVPHSRLGGRVAVHATALGKAILAFSEPEAVDEVLAGPLIRLTERTITDADALRVELQRARRERVAYDVEESQTGLFCVAAPILDSRRLAVGAVSVTGATALDIAQRFAPAVQTTALAIGAGL